MRTRKALGQHFLSHGPLLAKIAAVTDAGVDNVVLEIGPGPGGLTSALLDRGAVVVAIERDPRMSAELVRRFTGRPFVLIEGDALDLDWPALVAPWTRAGKRWLVAGNIPYNITSPLLDKALSAPLPVTITYLVQKEVADRIVAPAGHDDYGALSINIAAVAEASRRFTVGRGAFAPPPKVDSAVLHLVPRAEPLISATQIDPFRRLVTSIFSYRRKRMHRAVRQALGLSAEQAQAALDQAGIDADVRPEVVPMERFVALLGAVGSLQPP